MLIGSHRGGLLWGPRADSWQHHQARGGGWRGVGAPEGERDYERGCAESIHSPPSATLPVSHLPEGMRQADNRGLPVTCSEGQKAESWRRRGLDLQLGRRRAGTRRGRRDEGAQGESRCSSQPAGREEEDQGCRRWHGRSGVSQVRKGEERAQEEEKEESQEKRKRYPGWTSCIQSLGERTQEPLRRDQSRSQRKGASTSPFKGPKIHREQKEQDQQWVRGQQRQLFTFDSGGLQGPRVSVPGGDQSQGGGSALPGGTDNRGDHHDEEVLADVVGRGNGRYSGAPDCTPVFQECAGKKEHRRAEPRAPELVGSARLPVARQSRGSGRHPGTASKGAGGCLPRHKLEHRPKDGDSPWRHGRIGSAHRATTCKEGGLRGGKNEVAVPECERVQRRWQEQGEGAAERRQRALEERRPAEGQQESERERKGEEVIHSPRQAYSGRVETLTGVAPEAITGAASFTAGERAGLGRPGLPSPTEEVQRLVQSQKTLCLFPTSPPMCNPGGVQAETFPAPFVSSANDGNAHQAETGIVAWSDERKKDGSNSLSGLKIHELGVHVHQRLLEVLTLRSSAMGKRKSKDIFPLPTSRSSLVEVFPDLDSPSVFWMMAICTSLNSLWGGELHYDGKVSKVTEECLRLLLKDVARLQQMEGTVEQFSWGEFFNTRGIDYKEDEVRTARTFSWANIAPALPEEIGRVPLEEVCTLGARHYVMNFDSFIKDRSSWILQKPPRVMVRDEHWAAVCQGLVRAGVCTLLPVEEVFDTGQGPLLNGLFGVTKDEWVGDTEVFRLIMNLIPLNHLAHPLRGDVETLPAWSLMNPFFLQPSENLLISSEDVRCFFYTMAVPLAWHKYLAFNKRVPDCCLAPHLQGREIYLAARVLPMGFLNSVSLAQHVHRNLALWSSGQDPHDAVNPPEAEIRKDRSLTQHNPSRRIYLDNYDLLEKVESIGVNGMAGSLAPSVLALRNEYKLWEVPRNLKKSVSCQVRAEVQGAQVDGQEGVAYPRESKLLKYISAALSLMDQEKVTQKQLQVVCGGLVYFSMFRRPLLGSLNSVWQLIESFSNDGPQLRPFPPTIKAEIMRLVSLIPLARLNFRLPVHSQVTCSDASCSGGGICASAGTTRWGALVSEGKLRGELPEVTPGTPGSFNWFVWWNWGPPSGDGPLGVADGWPRERGSWPHCNSCGRKPISGGPPCSSGRGHQRTNGAGVGTWLLPGIRSGRRRWPSLSGRQRTQRRPQRSTQGWAIPLVSSCSQGTGSRS